MYDAVHSAQHHEFQSRDHSVQYPQAVDQFAGKPIFLCIPGVTDGMSLVDHRAGIVLEPLSPRFQYIHSKTLGPDEHEPDYSESIQVRT